MERAYTETHAHTHTHARAAHKPACLSSPVPALCQALLVVAACVCEQVRTHAWHTYRQACMRLHVYIRCTCAARAHKRVRSHTHSRMHAHAPIQTYLAPCDCQPIATRSVACRISEDSNQSLHCVHVHAYARISARPCMKRVRMRLCVQHACTRAGVCQWHVFAVLWVHVCEHMCQYMVCVFRYSHACTCVHAPVHACVHVGAYACTRMSVRVCMCRRPHVCVCTCV